MIVKEVTIRGISKEELFESLNNKLKEWGNPIYTHKAQSLYAIFVERWFFRAQGNLMVSILIEENKMTIIAGGGTGLGSAESKAIKYVIRDLKELSKSKHFSFEEREEERIYEEPS
ncbi:hypothetical protein ABOONEI_2147 [Aciduliprofundum boonei T469]|nr:hypothetical protein ABOONEI_2147 [Aciduliprofundum boonei T469]